MPFRLSKFVIQTYGGGASAGTRTRVGRSADCKAAAAASLAGAAPSCTTETAASASAAAAAWCARTWSHALVNSAKPPDEKVSVKLAICPRNPPCGCWGRRRQEMKTKNIEGEGLLTFSSFFFFLSLISFLSFLNIFFLVDLGLAGRSEVVGREKGLLERSIAQKRARERRLLAKPVIHNADLKGGKE
jgi:hypothetical protein